MAIKFKFRSLKEAEKAAKLLPIGRSWYIYRDRTMCAFLVIPDCYLGYLRYYSSNIVATTHEHAEKGGAA